MNVCDDDGCLDLGQMTQVLAYSFIACLINDASFCSFHYFTVDIKINDCAPNAQEHLCLSTKLVPNAITNLVKHIAFTQYSHWLRTSF